MIWRRAEYPRVALEGDLDRYVGGYVLVCHGIEAPVPWYVAEVSRGGRSLELANGYKLYATGKIRDENAVWVGCRLIDARVFRTADAARYAITAMTEIAAARARLGVTERDRKRAARTWRRDALARVRAAVGGLSDAALRELDISLEVTWTIDTTT